MPNPGDHISLHDDIDPGRGSTGRNKLSDPATGTSQTNVSDYTGGTFNGWKIAGQHNPPNAFRSSAIQYLNNFYVQRMFSNAGKHQEKIFGDPKQWEWQVWDKDGNKQLSHSAGGSSPIGMLENNGWKTKWICRYATPASGMWVRFRVRFKDIGGINNHISGISDWHFSGTFRVQGAEIPPMVITTVGENGSWNGSRYGLNDGRAKFKIEWPVSSNNQYKTGFDPAHQAICGPISFYNINIYNADTGHHFGQINLKPGKEGQIKGLNSSVGQGDGGTNRLRWLISAWDSSGRVVIPAFGSAEHRPAFQPDHLLIYFSAAYSQTPRSSQSSFEGTSWTVDYSNNASRRPPNL